MGRTTRASISMRSSPLDSFRSRGSSGLFTSPSRLGIATAAHGAGAATGALRRISRRRDWLVGVSWGSLGARSSARSGSTCIRIGVAAGSRLGSSLETGAKEK